MMRFASDWLATLRGLGESFLEVLQAEIDAIRKDLTTSGRLVLQGARLMIVALIFLFWMVGTLIFAVIALLYRQAGMEFWQAALLVMLVLLVAAVVMYLLARSRFREVKSPGVTVGLHAREHVDWLKSELGEAQEPDE